MTNPRARSGSAATLLRVGVLSAIVLCLSTSTSPVVAAPKSIAVMNCGLIDDNAAQNDAALTRGQQDRVAMVSDALRDLLSERQLYRVADNAPAGSLIAKLSSMQDLSACNGCELKVARELGVERIGVCWVQKVSNLILNINLRIENVADGKTVFERSVDIRGNTDLSWRRGVKALVDLLATDPDASKLACHRDAGCTAAAP
jgi:Protein of unknown function (DUF2380)